MIFSGCTGSNDTDSKTSESAAAVSSDPVVAEEPEVDYVTFSEDAINMVTTTLEENTGVRDAGIAQRDELISIAIIVDYSVSESYAKELGDSAVRLCMSLGEGTAPGYPDIGKSKNDYLVGIYYSDKSEFVSAAKVSGDPTLW
ncbi:hypothetical protein HNP93_001013 [Methanococcus maripaludis]|uniref:Uncharacterized protein n=1 Tax=Methanococcus maripaludis TaxID=39152 RepID=A0A7J9P537_METMI|nr:hypothetical protein [Methanococcus maripaludis]MBA2858312.1 hypothetical protein [Methanococcus maripaludis]